MQTLNFIFNNTQLNIYGTIDDPVFIVNDICKIINIDSKSRMIMEIKNNQKFRGCNLPPLNLPEYRGQQLSAINERGLYEIMFRSNSKLYEQFKDEIYEYLKQQRLSQNTIQSSKIKSLEELVQQQIQKLIDQKIQHQRELENREKIYSVISIHKIDDDYDDEIDIDIMKPQLVCITTNPKQIFKTYTALLDNYYGEEKSYHPIVLAEGLKKDEALDFKNEHLRDTIKYNGNQIKSRQSVTPLFD